MGAAAARQGRYGAAVGWLLRGNDGRRTGEVVGSLVRAVEAALEVRSTPFPYRYVPFLFLGP